MPSDGVGNWQRWGLPPALLAWVRRFPFASFERASKASVAEWDSGNWRLTFAFRDGNVYVLDYEDYHG